MSWKRKLGSTLCALALLGGCGEETSSPGGTQRVSAGLTRAASCDDLLSSLQEDALAKVDTEVGYLKEWYVNGEYYSGYPEPLAAGGERQDDGFGSEAPPTSAPGNDAEAGGDSGGKAPTGHSETNTQVKGVDEADIVKTDGEHIYVLSNNKLQILKSWPAAETALVGTFDLGGNGTEMFVAKGRAVVFSYANDLNEAQIKGAGFDSGIYACPVYDVGVAPGGSDGTGGASPGTETEPPKPSDPGDNGGSSEDSAGAAEADAPVGPGGGGGYYCGPSFTKISVINIAKDSKPKLEREFYFQGSYTSSRRHGDVVRAVLQSSFELPATVPYFYQVESTDYDLAKTKSGRAQLVKAYAALAKSAIKKTKLADWLPAAGEMVAGNIEPIAPDCGNFYLPAPGLTDFGLTSVVGFDMTDDNSAVSTTTILGAASTVYASDDALVLVQPDWAAQWRETDAETQSDQSSVHEFTVSADNTASNYEGSGFVPGVVKDQFSLDEKDGILRISTTRTTWPVYKYDDVAVSSPPSGGSEDDPAPEVPAVDGGGAPTDPAVDAGMGEKPAPNGETDAGAAEPDPDDRDGGGAVTPTEPVWTGPVTENFVTTLKLENGELVIYGQTAPMAEGERIFSTRYIGDIGYVVTFRQVDPLFAVDLSDAKNPKVIGELKIPGFSEYMHPLDDTHLLTIGRDSGNWDAGLALQIFDVSDPTKPKQTHKHVFAEGGYSEASYNHKAFTYYAEKKLLAFPYVKYYPEFGSSLELFSVDKTAGFSHLGAVSHTTLVEDQCGDEVPMLEDGADAVYWNCSYQPEVRRGLFINDDDTNYVYSLSWSGILVHDLTDLDNAVATVLLP